MVEAIRWPGYKIVVVRGRISMRIVLGDMSSGEIAVHNAPAPELRKGGILVRTSFSAICAVRAPSSGRSSSAMASSCSTLRAGLTNSRMGIGPPTVARRVDGSRFKSRANSAAATAIRSQARCMSDSISLASVVIRSASARRA